jgi:iron-sulfur cluster repair protein YtfE (RIC family)
VQRHPTLHRLSSDHHSGLVLARRARQAAQGDRHQRSAAWASVMDRFDAELEPHFQAEEADLLPAMRRAGETALVERTLQEHAALRALLGEGRSENLEPFADLLTQHIRFEEKELFERAQQVLAPAILDGLTGE